MLEHLPPEVDPAQLVLVGLSNGARGAAVIARDPAFVGRFRGTVLLFGASARPSDPHWDQKISAPLVAIYGKRDNRFRPETVERALMQMEQEKVHAERVPLDGSHFLLFSDPGKILSPLMEWLERLLAKSI